MSKVTNMTCNLLWTRQKVTDCILPQEPSYSLLSPDISQVATCLPQKLSYSLKIFKTGAKLQHAFSKQEPNYNLHSRQVTESKLQPEPRYSLHLPDRTKVQPAFIRHDPRYNLPSPDMNQETACILQTGTKVQFTFFSEYPSYNVHLPD